MVPEQVVHVGGPAWQPFTLWVIEGGLFLGGVPGGGFEVAPFDANTAVAVRVFEGQIGADGNADIPITLERSLAEAGISHLLAAFDNHYGMFGPVSDRFVIALEP
jgi:hypothetical protein